MIVLPFSITIESILSPDTFIANVTVAFSFAVNSFQPAYNIVFSVIVVGNETISFKLESLYQPKNL